MVIQSKLRRSQGYYRQVISAVLFVMTFVILTGCGHATGAEKEEITVFAASSLRDSVTDISRAFEASYEDTTVNISFAGSKTLRAQLENGAPADIFLSANERHYKKLLDQGILVEGKKILTNEMVMVVSLEAAGDIKSLEDLQKPHHLILADKEVPAGDYAREVICSLGQLYGRDYEASVLENLASSESNVRQVLTKVVLGEGDAAIVYKTDITKDIADKVIVLPIPADYNVTASYWIGLVNNDMISESVRNCRAFFEEDESCEIFETHGFNVVE